MKKSFQTFLVLFLGVYLVEGCIWDTETSRDKTPKNPKMLDAINPTTLDGINPRMLEVLSGGAAVPDTARLTNKIDELKRHPRTEDPAWWNDLAGAYLRLGKPDEAVKVLEPVLAKFDSNYAIHANLGTAYHLLGRYQEAQREIARDLEINPDAHFGLEKYHLALLQYLCRDEKHRFFHVYVDELSLLLFRKVNDLFTSLDEEFWLRIAQRDFPGGLAEAEKVYEEFRTQTSDDFSSATFLKLVALDTKPAYRAKWNLEQDPSLQEGIIYMASLNPKEPACFVMLGLASLRAQDFTVALAAFEKAVALRSPQSSILKERIKELKTHIGKLRELRKAP